MDDGTFDTAIRALTRTLTSRRSAASGLVAALVSVAPALDGLDALAKNRGGKGNGNKTKKKKTKRRCTPEPQSCSGGACGAEPTWAGNQCQINHCEFICRQCSGDDPREFCIRDGVKPDRTPTKVAVCCDEGETCCGDECCGSHRHCCGGKSCCAATQDCCGDRCVPSDDPVIKCCDGRVHNTNVSPEHCGSCGRACAADDICLDGRCECAGPNCECRNCSLPGLECCPGQGCVFVEGEDANNCGGCGVTCPRGQRCIDGQCGCGPGYKYCPLATRCVDEDYECCGGLPIGYCFPPFPCCGSGLDAFCSPSLTCP